MGGDVEYADRDTLSWHVLHRYRNLALSPDNIASILNSCMSVVFDIGKHHVICPF